MTDMIECVSSPASTKTADAVGLGVAPPSIIIDEISAIEDPVETVGSSDNEPKPPPRPPYIAAIIGSSNIRRLLPLNAKHELEHAVHVSHPLATQSTGQACKLQS
jgi:hypothetical protein